MGYSKGGRTSWTSLLQLRRREPLLVVFLIQFPYIFLKNKSFCFFVLHLLSQNHSVGLPETFHPKFECTDGLQALHLVVWRKLSQSGGRFLQPLTRWGFFQFNCGQLCYIKLCFIFSTYYKIDAHSPDSLTIFSNHICQNSIVTLHLAISLRLIWRSPGPLSVHQGTKFSQEFAAEIGSLVSTQPIRSSKKQNSFFNEILCHISPCYCCERNSDNEICEVISYGQVVFVPEFWLRATGPEILASIFATPPTTVNGCNSFIATQLLRSCPLLIALHMDCHFYSIYQRSFSSCATRTIVDILRESFVMQSSFLLLWSPAVVQLCRVLLPVAALFNLCRLCLFTYVFECRLCLGYTTFE